MLATSVSSHSVRLKFYHVVASMMLGWYKVYFDIERSANVDSTVIGCRPIFDKTPYREMLIRDPRSRESGIPLCSTETGSISVSTVYKNMSSFRNHSTNNHGWRSQISLSQMGLVACWRLVAYP